MDNGSIYLGTDPDSITDNQAVVIGLCQVTDGVQQAPCEGRYEVNGSLGLRTTLAAYVLD